MDMRQADESQKDPRIQFIMAVDPAPIDVLMPDSFSGIQMPIAIMSLGRIEELPLTVRADKAAPLISRPTYSTIDDASHYRMFAQCKPGAAEIAIAE